MSVNIGLVLFPNLTQLDLTGPFEVFARIPDVQVHLIWKDLNAVRTDRGLTIMPTTTFADCPKLDVICVPGGPGQVDLMDDDEVLEFLNRVAPDCQYVTSVCTGALVLGAAGLLKGYQATTYWAAHDQLRMFGAEPIKARVVKDRNRITGAGVTSGIDFALAVAAELAGDTVARGIQLAMEYDPAPPFDAGTPEKAGPEAIMEILENTKALRMRRLMATNKAAGKLS